MTLGVDLVHLPTFMEQLEVAGSRLSQPGIVFSGRELRRAQAQARRKGDSWGTHLGAVWALKEAVIKAWSAALANRSEAPPLQPEEILWPEIQVHHLEVGVPVLRIVGAMGEICSQTLGENCQWQLSASHDGDYAIGVALLNSGGLSD